jgi:phosphatidylserine/phosphatidylglycerophosphate/cardiolipin synthase-like enzyme
VVVHSLYQQLDHPEEQQRLRVHWYTAKDMNRPINAKFKKRSCHIKLLIADGRVAVQGSGNQDTQSWFHSMEINIMIDSVEVCEAWREIVERNQNTGRFGKVSTNDGVWRDEEGAGVEGCIGVDPGKFSWAKGIIGAVQRVRGAGGF